MGIGKIERTTENVVVCLLSKFHGSTAVEYDAALSQLVSHFTCQRTTAATLLQQAIAEGAVYDLRLVEGSIHEVALRGETRYTLDDFPVLVRGGGYNTGSLTVSDRRVPHRDRTQAVRAVAVPLTFDPWATEHIEAVKAKKATRKAEEEAQEAAVHAAFPTLAPVAEFGQQWKRIADAAGKGAPLETDLDSLRSGKPMLRLVLHGEQLERMGPELLALLQRYYPLPDDIQEAS